MELVNVKPKTTIEGQAQTFPPLPKRPLTSFNLFSMLERKYIILQHTKQDPELEDLTANIDDLNIEPYGAQRPQRYAELVLPADWYVVGANRIKRKDHKNHGLISFMDLSKELGNRWKNADNEIKEYCKKIADGELEKYREDQEKYKKKYGKAAFDYQKKQKKVYKKRKSNSDDSATTSNKRGKSEDERVEVKSQGKITTNNVHVAVPNEVMIHQNYSNQQMSSNMVSSTGTASSANALPTTASSPYSNVYNVNLRAAGLHGKTHSLPAIVIPPGVLLNSMGHYNSNQVMYYVPTMGLVHGIPDNTLASDGTRSTILNIPPVCGSRLSTQKFVSSVTSKNNFGSNDSLKFGLDFKTFNDSEVLRTDLTRVDSPDFGLDFKTFHDFEVPRAELTRADSPDFGLDFKTFHDFEVPRAELTRDDSLKFGLDSKTLNGNNHSAILSPEFKAFNGDNHSEVLNPKPELKRCTSIGEFDGAVESLPLGREVVSAFELPNEH
eukprot:scaffold92943_cov72-Cyclotella_meneghiniana.AAC.3